MTQATGFLGRREFHGALAKHSPFSQRAIMCVVCSMVIRDTIRILDEICDDCFRKGWRPPEAIWL
jgi:hypothetical protein